MYQCAKCTQHGCKSMQWDRTMNCCPSKDDALLAQAKALYNEEENHNIAYCAACTEAEGYGNLCRMEEILLFMKKMGYHHIGLIFCIGLSKEAAEVNKILEYHGFDVTSIVCKNGGVPKAFMGLNDDQTISGNCEKEVMCNPIAQALLMNQQNVEFNILLGLCVGHDTLALKYIDAPATIFAVKDRVMGHNPLAPIYTAEGYSKKRLYPKKDS